MPRIEASADTLMRQAPMTATLYMEKAVSDIDALFGTGYAKRNPALVAAFMQTAAHDFHTAVLTSGLQDLADAVQALAQGDE